MALDLDLGFMVVEQQVVINRGFIGLRNDKRYCVGDLFCMDNVYASVYKVNEVDKNLEL